MKRLQGMLYRKVVGGLVWAAPALASCGAYAQALNVQMPFGSACPPNYYWEVDMGFAQCKTPPPAPPPPDPPVTSPKCVYEANRSYIAVGDAGQCTADGGCEGLGYRIVVNGSSVGGNQWLYEYMDNATFYARVDRDLAARYPQYYIGAGRGGVPGNGNTRGTSIFEVCTR